MTLVARNVRVVSLHTPLRIFACSLHAFSTSSTMVTVRSYPENVAIFVSPEDKKHCARKQLSPKPGSRGGGNGGRGICVFGNGIVLNLMIVDVIITAVLWEIYAWGDSLRSNRACQNRSM